jgi:hypothetical protein
MGIVVVRRVYVATDEVQVVAMRAAARCRRPVDAERAPTVCGTCDVAAAYERESLTTFERTNLRIGTGCGHVRGVDDAVYWSSGVTDERVVLFN